MPTHHTIARAVALAAALTAGCGGPPPERRLCDAIVKGDVAEARQALTDRALDISRLDDAPCRPVQSVFGRARPEDAALTGIGVEMVKAGLPGNASWQSDRQVWAVEAAARNGNSQLVRALMAVGLDPSGDEAERALRAAAAAGQREVVEFLLEAGVDPEGDGGTDSPLMLATANGHAEVAAYLGEIIEARTAAAAARTDDAAPPK
jgi:hypothetical protein